METGPIVPELDVPGNILLRFLPREVDGTVDPLDLHRRIERLGEGIVETYPGPAYRLPDAQTLKNGVELSRGVVTAPVRMKHSTFREIEIARCHLDRRGYERCLVIAVHRPADAPTR